MRYPAPPDAELRRFLAALRSVESGGRYDAVNASSGARGAYQIMPANWPAWASTYLGDRRAEWTPANQDAVARGKVIALYRWLGDWRRVAAFWLAGGAAAKGDPARWSDTLTRYVGAVMSRFNRYGSGAGGSDSGSGSGSAQDGPRAPEPAGPVAVPALAPVAPVAPGCGPVAALLLTLAAIAAAGVGALRLP